MIRSHGGEKNRRGLERRRTRGFFPVSRSWCRGKLVIGNRSLNCQMMSERYVNLMFCWINIFRGCATKTQEFKLVAFWRSVPVVWDQFYWKQSITRIQTLHMGKWGCSSHFAQVRDNQSGLADKLLMSNPGIKAEKTLQDSKVPFTSDSTCLTTLGLTQTSEHSIEKSPFGGWLQPRILPQGDDNISPRGMVSWPFPQKWALHKHHCPLRKTR